MADTLDVISLAEGKAALNITDTNNDTELAVYITAVSRRLDDICGPIVKRDVTDELYPGGLAQLALTQAPASDTATTTISAVTEYSGGTAQALAAESLTSSTSYDFTFDATTGLLSRRAGWSDATFGAQRVKVTYAAGRYADTASVDAKFKLAAQIMLQHVWRPGQGFGGSYSDAPLSGFAVPNAVAELLADEMQPPTVA